MKGSLLGVVVLLAACHHEGVGADSDLATVEILDGGADEGATSDLAPLGCPSDCSTPPEADCADAQTRRSYAAPGTCVAGTCVFPQTDSACENGCYAGRCYPCGSSTALTLVTPTSAEMIRRTGPIELQATAAVTLADGLEVWIEHIPVTTIALGAGHASIAPTDVRAGAHLLCLVARDAATTVYTGEATRFFDRLPDVGASYSWLDEDATPPRIVFNQCGAGFCDSVPFRTASVAGGASTLVTSHGTYAVDAAPLLLASGLGLREPDSSGPTHLLDFGGNLLVDLGDVNAAQVAPGGQQVLYVHHNGTAHELWLAGSSTPKQLAADSSNLGAWFDSTRFFSFVDNVPAQPGQTLLWWDLSLPSPTQVDVGVFGGYQVSPDGHYLFYSRNAGGGNVDLGVLDGKTGVAKIVRSGVAPTALPSKGAPRLFEKTGRVLLADTQFYLTDLDGGNATPLGTLTFYPVDEIVVRSDQHYLALPKAAGGELVDLVARTTTSLGAVKMLAFAPVGDRFVGYIQGASPNGLDLYLGDVLTGTSTQIAVDAIGLPQFSADATQIVYTKGSQLIVHPTAGGADVVLSGSKPSFSPSGATLTYATACVSGRCSVSVWSPTQSATAIPGAAATRVIWSPDGQRLALLDECPTGACFGLTSVSFADGLHPARPSVLVANRVSSMSDVQLWRKAGGAFVMLQGEDPSLPGDKTLFAYTPAADFP